MASIAKRPNGRWRARYRDDAGKEHAKHFDRKSDAQRWLDEVTAAVVTGSYIDPKLAKTTFATFYATWSRNQVWESTTTRAMNLAATSVTFSSMPLSKLRRSHIEAWVKDMKTRGLAPTTIRTRFNNVRTVLRAAVADRQLAWDPSTGVRLPPARRSSAAMMIPTAQEVGRLLRTDFAVFTALCAFAGLRLGEAAALRRSDVNFLGRTITVARQVQRAGGSLVEIRPPKYGSEREVYIPDGLVALLAEHVRELQDPSESAWLFPSEDGRNPIHQNTAGHRWRRAREAAGVSSTLRLHDMRHFYASGLIAAGCDVVTVQRALGHKSATVTLSTYSHLWPNAEDRTRKAAQELFSSAVADPVRTTARETGSDLGR